MRKCGNCYDSCKVANECGEELYCMPADIEGFVDKVNFDDVCEYHRYLEENDEEQNYVLYDKESQSVFIVHKQNNNIDKILKITEDKENKEFSVERFGGNTFTFRDKEDDENGLFKTFSRLTEMDKDDELKIVVDKPIVNLVIEENIRLGQDDRNYYPVAYIFDVLSENFEKVSNENKEGKKAYTKTQKNFN